ncbi:hypothetical protein JTB14_037652 [Gonioctena quinquepunctata]|nr:hypothetical protein JTB14_037652 [Gonioctena quinquepunctata]
MDERLETEATVIDFINDIAPSPEDKWKDITEKAWIEISKETEFSVPASSGSSAKSKKPYYLHDYLLFLLPYVKPINRSESPGNSNPPNSTETQVSLQVEDTATNNHEESPAPSPLEVFLNDNYQNEDYVPSTANTPKNTQPSTKVKKKEYAR